MTTLIARVCLSFTGILCLTGIAQGAPFGWGFNGTGAVGTGNITTVQAGTLKTAISDARLGVNNVQSNTKGKVVAQTVFRNRHRGSILIHELDQRLPALPAAATVQFTVSGVNDAGEGQPGGVVSVIVT